MIEVKEKHTFRFKPSEFKEWKKRAKKARLTLTAWMEKKLNNDDNDKHLFI